MKTRDPADRLVDRYLSDLEHALRALPPSRRRQIVEEISDHIAQGRAASGIDDEASVRALLDRVGDPETIAEEAGAIPDRPRRSDAFVSWLLLLGGFLFVVGWFVGVFLLWSSDTWRLREKLLGTLVLPGGLLGVAALGVVPSSVSVCSGTSTSSPHCVSHGFSLPFPVGIGLLFVLLVAPMVTAVHLERMRGRP